MGMSTKEQGISNIEGGVCHSIFNTLQLFLNSRILMHYLDCSTRLAHHQ